jgi:hypothetical protein
MTTNERTTTEMTINELSDAELDLVSAGYLGEETVQTILKVGETAVNVITTAVSTIVKHLT